MLSDGVVVVVVKCIWVYLVTILKPRVTHIMDTNHFKQCILFLVELQPLHNFVKLIVNHVHFTNMFMYEFTIHLII